MTIESQPATSPRTFDHFDPAVSLLATALRRHLARGCRVDDAPQRLNPGEGHVEVAVADQSSVGADAPILGV
jgi:hypothetical protein